MYSLVGINALISESNIINWKWFFIIVTWSCGINTFCCPTFSGAYDKYLQHFLKFVSDSITCQYVYVSVFDGTLWLGTLLIVPDPRETFSLRPCDAYIRSWTRPDDCCLQIYYMNQCWLFVIWAVENKIRRNVDKNRYYLLVLNTLTNTMI